MNNDDKKKLEELLYTTSKIQTGFWTMLRNAENCEMPLSRLQRLQHCLGEVEELTDFAIEDLEAAVKASRPDGYLIV